MNRISFSVNGVKCHVGGEVSSDVTLLDYLREYLQLRGTKYLCREGGCGACIVSVARAPGENAISVNSCLVSITSCSKWEITTIEKVGNRLDGYHPIQKVFAENAATQCGYCTPGWIMAMFSLLKSKENLTMLEIEKSFGSNICRCTGYRPILEALKKFATDAPESDKVSDIEDLHSCKKDCKDCTKCLGDDEWCLLNKDDLPNILEIDLKDGRHWFRVSTITDIFDVLDRRGEDSYMLVAGNTMKGAYPIDEYPSTLIDISGVSELKGFSKDQNLIINAGSTLTTLLEIFKKVGEEDDFNYLKTFYDHLQLVAHIAVRNIGTLAGNLMMKHEHNSSTSDLFVLLFTVDAKLTIRSRNGSKTVSMDDFLKTNMKGSVIVKVLLPPLNNEEYKIVTYKIMPRAQNVHAIVNAGFLYYLKQPENIVKESRIIFSGLTSPFSRARDTESYLSGKKLFTNENLQKAVKILDKELVATENLPELSAEYRKQLALGLFYKGLLSLCPPQTLNSRYQSATTKLRDERLLSSGKQEFETDRSMWPLTKPMMKVEALRQCSAEVPFTEDLPSFPEEVFAAFVLTTVPTGKITNIDSSEALNQPGVLAMYTAKDIPGVNAFTPDFYEIIFYSPNEEVLCDGDVKYFNQPLGIIVAESRYLADKAAKMVKVTYENVKKPVTDIKQAKKDSTRVTEKFSFPAVKRGSDAIAKVIKGDTALYAQAHFPIETMVCVTVPDEDGFKVHHATQWMDQTQWVTRKALNIDANSIDVYCRRLGGAFGQKLSRAAQQAVACTLVASKLNRPCRFIQSLTTNMRAVGKRFPWVREYMVSVNKSGEIQYVNYALYGDSGYIVNEPVLAFALPVYSNVYDSSRWKFKGYDVITDTHKNTLCRAPGTFAAISLAEVMMERIAYELSLDPVDVRMANLDEKYNDIKEMYENLKLKSDYLARKRSVKDFNANNRWRKRGLRVAFMRYFPTGGQTLSVVLSVYHSDGTVAITHSGVDMGQGLNTKAVQIAAYYLNIPVEKIKIKGNSSMIGPNASLSGASTTTKNVGVGIERACKELLERLKPVKLTMPNASWEELISRAYNLTINLQTQGYTSVLEGATSLYNLFGVCFAEVEVDILTGESDVLRVDILQDAGRSLNPKIDIGQIEGAFMMGQGYWTSENIVYNRENGEILSDRTWNYNVPQARDIPRDFRIYLRKNSFGLDKFLGSKAVTEAPICLSVAVPLAIREAVASARLDAGIPTTEWFPIDGPYNLEKIRMASAVDIDDFKFS